MPDQVALEGDADYHKDGYITGSEFRNVFTEHHAGARSVVVSLWEVASKEAVEFMEIFYRNIKDGKNRADALKLARKEIKSRYPHPFYWAVFVLYGEG